MSVGLIIDKDKEESIDKCLAEIKTRLMSLEKLEICLHSYYERDRQSHEVTEDKRFLGSSIVIHLEGGTDSSLCNKLNERHRNELRHA